MGHLSTALEHIAKADAALEALSKESWVDHNGHLIRNQIHFARAWLRLLKSFVRSLPRLEEAP